MWTSQKVPTKPQKVPTKGTFNQDSFLFVTPLKTNMTLENQPCSIGNTYSNGGCSIVMLVFGGVQVTIPKKKSTGCENPFTSWYGTYFPPGFFVGRFLQKLTSQLLPVDCLVGWILRTSTGTSIIVVVLDYESLSKIKKKSRKIYHVIFLGSNFFHEIPRSCKIWMIISVGRFHENLTVERPKILGGETWSDGEFRSGTLKHMGHAFPSGPIPFPNPSWDSGWGVLSLLRVALGFDPLPIWGQHKWGSPTNAWGGWWVILVIWNSNPQKILEASRFSLEAFRWSFLFRFSKNPWEKPGQETALFSPTPPESWHTFKFTYIIAVCIFMSVLGFWESDEYTLPETNSLHLKHWGWKMSFLLGRPPDRCYVSSREGILLQYVYSFKFFLNVRIIIHKSMLSIIRHSYRF